MCQALTNEADGRVVLILEGGYDLEALCDCSESCMQALLGKDPFPFKKESLEGMIAPICQPTLDSLQRVLKALAPYWAKCLEQTPQLLTLSAEKVIQQSCPFLKIVVENNN